MGMDDPTEINDTGGTTNINVAQWQAAFDALEDMVVLVTEDRTILYANKAMKARFGPDLRPGEKCCVRVHGTPEPPGGCVSCMTFDSRESSLEVSDQTILGDTILELAAYPVLGENQDVLFVVHTFRDITDQVQRQRELEQKTRFNDLLLDTIPHPALVITREREILSANRKARDRGAVVGGFCWQTLGGERAIPDSHKEHIRQHGCPPPEGTRCHYCRAEEALAQGTPSSEETESGGRIFETCWVPLDEDRYLHYAIDVTEHKRTAEELRKTRDKLEYRVRTRTADLMEQRGRLRSLASQLSLAEERERRRIATELHDRISQALAVCKLRVAEVRKEMPRGPVRSELTDVEEAMGELVRDTRFLTRELCSPALYDLGFMAAVRTLCEQFNRQHGETRFVVRELGNLPIMPQDMQIELYKSIRELLVNAVKHSEAAKVTVMIDGDESGARVSVFDDGVGFPTGLTSDTLGKMGSFGLFGVRERMRYLGGELDIIDTAAGARLLITIPLAGAEGTK